MEQEASQKGTTEITTSKKINEFQSSPIGSRSDQLVALQPNKYSSKKNVRNLTIPLEKATLVKNRISALTSDNHVDTYRGTWNRFRKNLLVFISSPKNTFTSFSGLVCEANTRPGSNRNLEIKVRLSENLYSSFADLCFTAHLNSQLKEKQSSFFNQTYSATQEFNINKRLISRRVGLEVPAIPDFLKQSITTKRKGFQSNPIARAPLRGARSCAFEIEGLLFRGLTTDSFFLDFISVANVSNLLQGKILHFNSTLFSSNLKKEQVTDRPCSRSEHSARLSTYTKTTHENLIVCAHGNKEQDLVKIPLSVLLKKRNSNAKVYRGFYGSERLTIGIDSVSKVSPSVEVRKVRIGGATYTVPYVPHNSRQEGLGIRWLIDCASLKRERSKNSSELCLANELADSLKNQGESIKKRNQSHQIAAANRAYTRYRWW